MNTQTETTAEPAPDWIRQIKALGFRVFYRKGSKTYCYFSDGKSIGYIQNEGGYKTITVHRANGQTGTGFHANEFSSLTRENLLPAFAHAPDWARDVSSVCKYGSIEAFLKDHSWGGGLQEVGE